MTSWVSTALGLMVFTTAVLCFGLALLARIGSWRIAPAASLTFDEGLRIGGRSPEIAAHRHDDEYHLSFEGRRTFLVFGARGCAPCEQLLRAAARHPATRNWRLVYMSDADDVDLDPGIADRWEIYRFHDEPHSRRVWRAPVSPYFHVISEDSRILEKGIANAPEHLDRLFRLPPAGVPDSVPTPIAQ